MLSTSQIKLIRSLRLSKFRIREKLFVIEGDKLIKEALNPISNPNYKIHSIYALESWLGANRKIIRPFEKLSHSISNQNLKQISMLSTPNQVLALVHNYSSETDLPDVEKTLTIALDNIQDPGNMGTIIRLAEWYGVKNIIMSPGCSDPMNPKVVQATMGSIFRVNLKRQELGTWLKNLPKNVPVYGAVMDGANLYKTRLSSIGVILMGNESKGIQTELEEMISQPLTIPRAEQKGPGPESLNVSVALGIILSEFSRQTS